jgi:hypothetical protein
LDAEEGDFKHPITQDILNTSLFKNCHSHGVVNHQLFMSKLLLVTLVLILTAVGRVPVCFQ